MALPSVLDPTNTSVNDICTESLRECGYVGVGQVPLAEDLTGVQARLQWMLQAWERKRWFVFHLVTYSVVANGKGTLDFPYTIGPGGDFNTSAANPFNNQFNAQFGPNNPAPTTTRPQKIESAFLRQLVTTQPNQIDYPLEILQSMEDYNKIALKGLVSFPGSIFLDPAWPLGRVCVWPVPQPNIYAIFITVREQLPTAFPTANTKFTLPYEYYSAMLYNLAIRLRPKYGIPTIPGDQLPVLAKDSLAMLRSSNVAIARLQMPKELIRPRLYNIFNDRSY